MSFNNEVDAFPSIWSVMKVSDMTFFSNHLLDKLFLDNLLTCENEMHLSSYGVSEKVYNQINFDIDIDLPGNEYELTSKYVLVVRA